MIPDIECGGRAFSQGSDCKSVQPWECLIFIARFVPGSGQRVIRNEEPEETEIVISISFDPLEAVKAETSPVIELAGPCPAVLCPVRW